MSKLALLVSFLCGFASAYAFAPTYYLPILAVSFSVFAYIIFNASSYKSAFCAGWCFGFGYFLKGVYWISLSLLIDKAMFGWLAPLAVIFIPAVYAIYIGIAGVLIYRLSPKITWLFTLFFIVTWVLIEVLRSKLFTGFPLLTLGYVLSPHIHALQSASIIGVYGLSFLVLCISLLPFLIINTKLKSERTLATCIVSGFLILLTMLSYVYGFYRIQNSQVQYRDEKIRIVQPNIPQSIKWDYKLRDNHLSKIIALSISAPEDNIKLIVWPESATPGFFIEDEIVRKKIKHIIPSGAYLITGGVRRDRYEDWNSLFLINSAGEIVDHYDKAHLVPFGEYIPFREFLPFIQKITHGTQDFSRGIEKNMIITEALPLVRPLICYESFFPEEIPAGYTKADILINITNDAWYGDSPGPYQNADIARLRSIEYGIPMVRAANTGISFITDPYGQILKHSNLNEERIIDANITFPLATNTFYSVYKNYIVYCLAFFVLVLSPFLTKRKGVDIYE